MTNYIGIGNVGGNHGSHRQSSSSPYGGSVIVSSHSPGAPAGVATQQAFNAFVSQLANQTAQQLAGAGYAQQIANQFVGYATLSSTGVFAGLVGTAYPKLKLDHDIVAGEIIAWRCWRIADGWLRSVYMDTFWGCNEVMEGNVDTDGVHAWKKMGDAIEYGVMGGVHGGSMKIVIGTVALWGEVIEHEIGYRAQFAKIKSLDHGADASVTKEELQELRRKYLA